MGCRKCDDTGQASEYEPETGFVAVPCSECVGVDGEQPDVVTDGHDLLTQEDVETEAHLGLGAAAFLLLAEGHLRKAKEMLDKARAPTARTAAYFLVKDACDDVRHAQKLLKEEEPCKKPYTAWET